MTPGTIRAIFHPIPKEQEWEDMLVTLVGLAHSRYRASMGHCLRYRTLRKYASETFFRPRSWKRDNRHRFGAKNLIPGPVVGKLL